MNTLATIGQAMHLNGALPRGTDARTVLPKRCAVCQRVFLAFGHARARKFCDECKTTRRCTRCRRVGPHAATCPRARGRPCRGCGEDLGDDTRHAYCEACRAKCCPECNAYAGRHARACQYETRRRRPGLTEYHGVVTEQEILAVYLAHGPTAVRLARRICGAADAEDILQNVTLYLLEKRDYFYVAPGATYFLKAVRHTARRVRHYAWARYRVAMDPADLVLAEQAMARGASSPHTVRLPTET